MKVYTRLLNENFYKWFANSKGVFGENEPQVFYHKSRSLEPFEEFKYDDVCKNDYNSICHGFYFVAENNHVNISYMGSGADYYVFLKMENPFYFYIDGIENIRDSNGKKY